MITGRVNFRPRWYQRTVMTSQKRHRAVTMHRRAGKTVMAIFAGIETQLSCPLPYPRIGYIAPYLKQAKRIAWSYLESITHGGGRHFEINRGDLTTTFVPNKAKFSLLGADNLEAIRGEYFDLIIVDELADCDPRLWPSVIRPALADRHGRALMMGTPKGRMNLLYDLSKIDPDDPEWAYFCYPHGVTKVIDAFEIGQMRKDMSEAMFAQEMDCSFNAALVGAVYGREMNELQADGRYTMVKWDQSLPVLTAWDLGYRDATAIFYCQLVGTELRVIDYEEYTLTSLVKIGPKVVAKPYRYGAHYGPHDIAVVELGSGDSRRDILSRFGIDFEPTVNWSKEDGIEAVRALLPHLWIDASATRIDGACVSGGERALECLVNYEYEFDERQRSFKTAPRHNWPSHGCDALRMLAVALDKASRPVLPPRRGERQGWLI